MFHHLCSDSFKIFLHFICRRSHNENNENGCFVYPFPKQTLGFTCLHYKSFENTEGKGEMACNEQYLLFPQCFLPI